MISKEEWKNLILEVMIKEPDRKWTEQEVLDAAELLAIKRGLKYKC